jgi:phage gp16-like protein
MNYRFWTRWEAGDDKVQRQTIKFAQSKLIWNNDHSKIPDEAKLAVFARRLLLEFKPKREAAVRTETESVAAHMHIAYFVPAHREYLHSGALSEPILAERVSLVRFPLLRHSLKGETL